MKAVILIILSIFFLPYAALFVAGIVQGIKNYNYGKKEK
jgi:hypothetical protein